MTSEQVMLKRSATPRAGVLVLIALVGGLCVVGCEYKRLPVEPDAMVSPYPEPKLWAVAPFRNESGTSLADALAMSDKLSQQLAQVRHITVVPVNRVITAMGATGMREIASTEDALLLMRTLDLDGLIVGTVTGWYPYDPMKIGATVQLYSLAAKGSAADVDPRQLRRASTDASLPGLVVHRQPIAQASGHYDAANGAVLRRLQSYAHGRAPDDSPAGWRRYLLSMDLYSEFVGHELMRELFREEWDRLHDWTPATQKTAGLANHPQSQNRP